MKLKYLFGAFLAAAFAVGCETVDPLIEDYAEIKIENSVVSIPSEGGSATVTFTALNAWEIDIVPVKDKDDKLVVPDWLTVTPDSGAAGENITVTVSAEATASDRTAELNLKSAGKVQIVTVNQLGDPSLKPVYPAFVAGDYWIMFNVEGGWQVAKPLGSSSTYGYLYAEDAVVTDGALSSTTANKFTFTAVEGGFTISDASGRFYYMKGTYDSFNIEAAPAEGNVFTVEQTGEQEFMIVNASNGKYVQFDPKYSSAGAYDSERGVLPYLVAYSEPSEEHVEPEVVPSENIAKLNESIKAKAASYELTLTDAVVTYVNGKNAFVEDATGGVLVYFEDHGLVAGDKLNGTATGSCELYNGVTEITSMDMTNVTKTTGADIPCTELTIAQLLENFDRYASCRVKLSGVTVTDELTTSDRNGEIAQGETTIPVYAKVKETIVIAANTVGDMICYPVYNREVQQVGIWQNEDFTVTSSGEPGEGDEDGGEDGDEPVVGSTETITFSEIFTEATELTDGTTYTWGGLSVTFTKRNNSTTNYNAGDAGLRWYQDDVMAFDAGSKTIVKMEFETYGGKTGPLTADTGKVVDGTTWEGSASVVTLTASKQIRVKSIKVSYAETGDDTPDTPETPANLITNGGFENGTEGWTGLWGEYTNEVVDNGYEGKCIEFTLKASCTAMYNAQLFWPIALEVGKTYQYSFYAKADSEQDIQFLAQSDENYAARYFAIEPLTSEWKKYEGEFTYTAEDPANIVRVGVQFGKEPATGGEKVWVDNFVFNVK